MTRKRISLALQGGGAHGAFTWGVLDRLLEDGRLDVAAICGTSAGAMNAAVVAHGIATAEEQGARVALRDFWTRIAAAAVMSPLRPTPLDKALSRGNMDFSPFWLWYDGLSRVASPYVTNPMGFNPLRDVVEAVVDFELIQRTGRTKLFLCATNVRSARIKVFQGREITCDAVMASACLPFLFRAVEIDGEAYWDGGYMGNPPLYPLIYGADCEDLLIIQINPIRIGHVPTTANEIMDRVNELSFNASLMREMRTISFVTKLIDDGRLDRGRYKRLNIHTIDAEAEMAELGYSSKLNADLEFVTWLFELGRERGRRFMNEHFDKIGVTSSTDIVAKFL